MKNKQREMPRDRIIYTVGLVGYFIQPVFNKGKPTGQYDAGTLGIAQPSMSLVKTRRFDGKVQAKNWAYIQAKARQELHFGIWDYSMATGITQAVLMQRILDGANVQTFREVDDFVALLNMASGIMDRLSAGQVQSETDDK